MELHVEHTTEYRYTEPNRHSIQYIRLTPVSGPGQQVRDWWIEAPGLLHAWQDGFGNYVNTLVVDKEHDLLTLRVRGTVNTVDTNGVIPVTGAPESALYLLQPTKLTKPNETMVEMTKGLGSPKGGKELDFLHQLMDAIEDKVTYIPGETDVDTTAEKAFEAGRGVCQDHAHIFAACARIAGFPARYVSGYLSMTNGGAEHQASHAWAEALVPGLGWVSFDPANGICPDERYVRVAVGRDYADAAPVRGIRTGAGEELLAIRVAVKDKPSTDDQ